MAYLQSKALFGLGVHLGDGNLKGAVDAGLAAGGCVALGSDLLGDALGDHADHQREDGEEEVELHGEGRFCGTWKVGSV